MSGFAMDERISRLSADEKARLLKMAQASGLRTITTQAPPIVRADRNSALPASWSQQRLWFLDRLDDASAAAYHITGSLRLKGALDEAALRRALNAMLERHEALRTVFSAVDGQAVQVILPAQSFALQARDLSDHGAEQRHAALRREAEEEWETRFDLSTGPLIRGRLLRLAAQDHVLAITMHHIVSDGWSLGIFARELQILYAAYQQGRDNPLPPLPLQYVDYAQWQRQWLQGENLERQLRYWRAHLQGAASQLELPVDRARPATQSYRGDNLKIALDAGLCTKLKAFAQRHELTLFMVLYAAWSMLLSRLSGQDEVVIGTPVANRQRQEVEGLIGFFVNSLVLRVQVQGHLPVAEFFARVKEVVLGAFDHQDVPFELVVEALQPQRSLSRNPLFQVMLVLLNTPKSELRLADLDVKVDAGVDEPAKLDLLLSLEERGDEISGNVSYATDLFDRDTIERWMTCFQVLLRALTDEAHACVGDLPILPHEQRHRVVKVFNATQASYPHDKCIHELFEEQVARAPNVVAVMHGHRSLTYAELNAKANQLAHCLRAQGIGSDQLVGICVERSVEMVIGLLGILKAGGAYVPLDPNYPPERLAYMLSDAAPRVVLTQESLRALLPDSGALVLVFDRMLADLATYSTDNLSTSELGLTACNLVYVIYTSGSTGHPKGTTMPHRAMVNLIAWHRDNLPAEGQRVLQFAALSFDVAFQDTFSTLCTGGTLVLLDEWVRRDMRAMTELVNEYAIDRLFVPPLVLQSLAEYFETTGIRPRRLQDVVTAGEQLRISPEIVRLFKHLGGGRLHNHYGPTETHVVTALTLDDRPEAWPAFPAIGRPIANAQIYILDAHRQPVSVGVVGEIYIGGAGVARGYLGRPELTAQRFIDDPFSAEPAARLYRTGDLGRWRADGTIEYLGRNDEQVKIRGYRIECAEIAQQLSAHAQIQEAVVIAREDRAGEKCLVAYFTVKEQSEPGIEELRAHLSERLPEYMVPTAYVRLEAIPLSANGKLDKRALPAPPISAYSHREYEAPHGEIEERLAGIWQELLSIERIGRHDNFFDLGGHSLRATQLVSRVRQALGRELTLRSVFLVPTVAGLARELVSAGRVSQSDISRADRSKPLPAAWRQELIWRWETTRPREIPLMYCSGLRLRGALDNPALVAALDTMVERHEILRTGFELNAQSNELVQCIAQHARFPLQEFDLTDRSPPQQESQVFELYRKMGTEPFDLSTGPLIRACLIRLSDTLHVLLMGMHYMICDAWSLEVLIREASTLYNAYKAGRSNPLPPLSIQYADYAVWQRQRLQGETLQHHVAYYKEQLAGAPKSLTLPLDRPRPDEPSHRDGIAHAHCGPQLSSELKRLAQQHDVSLFMVLLAGYALMLTRVSNQKDVLIGAQAGNRQRAELESLIGPFANGIVFRLQVDERMTVIEFLHRVREVALAAQSHQALPGPMLNELLMAQQQTVGAVFRMQNEPRAMLQLDELAVEPQSDGPGGRLGVAYYDLLLMVGESSDRIPITLHYEQDLFEHATATAWGQRLQAALSAMAQYSRHLIGTLKF